jgi:hypothetical protein
VARNITFDGIEITQPAAVEHRGSSTLIGAHGQDVVNPHRLSAGWLDKVEIKNCYVHDFDFDIRTGVGVIGMGSWCRRVTIHDNRLENLGPNSNAICGCYLDTGASEDLVIENNTFSGIPHGIFVSAGSSYPLRNWTFRNNRIAINRNFSSGGIEIESKKAPIRNVVIQGNSVDSSTGETLTAYGILLSKVSDAVVRDNVIDGVHRSINLVFRNAAANCRAENNRSRSGASITAKRKRID